MDKNSTVGSLFEQGKNAADDSVSNIADTAKQQILGNKPTGSIVSDAMGTEAHAQLSEQSKEIVEDFYAPSAPSASYAQEPQALVEREDKLSKVRAELQSFKGSLHKATYYDPLFAYEGKIEDKKRQEESEKENEEEHKKMEDLKVQEKNKQDIAQFRAERSIEIKGQVAG